MEKIEVSHSELDAQFIRERINEFNFKRVPDYDHQTLNLVVRRQDTIIAGLLGDTAWDWLYISYFWVHEHERSLGLGTRVLAAAEEMAMQRGCRDANLETHDFQSLGFYLKRGYVVFGKLENFPRGHTKYYLCKHLAG